MDKLIVQQALEMALRAGADQARVVLTESSLNTYSLLDGELERLQHSLSSSLYFQLYVDGRYGTFSTNRMEPSDFEKYLHEAVESTRLLAPDTCRTCIEAGANVLVAGSAVYKAADIPARIAELRG